MSSKKLSLEETREQNIARNNEFLLQLFGTNVLSKQHNMDFAQNNQQNKNLINTNANKNYADHCINEYYAINNQICKHDQIFLYRHNEINELFGYLSNNLNESPALVNVGPSGCGKTDLTLSVLNSIEVSYVHMSCKGFNNIKQFISSLWLATKKSLENALRLYHSIHTLKSKIQDLLILQIKPPTKFIDYAYALGKIVSFLFNDNDEVDGENKEDNITSYQLNKKDNKTFSSMSVKKQQVQTIQKKYFYVHLDSLDNISYSEQISSNKNGNSIITNLLNLMYYSHPRVKVIANMENLPSLIKPCLVIKYSSYDDKQMLAILMHRFKTKIIHLKGNNIQLIIDRINSLDSRLIENLDMENNEQIEFIYKVYSTIIDNVFSSYQHLANHSLVPLMASISCGCHPKLVYDATISVWIALYGYIPEKYILEILSNILQLWPKRHDIISTIITNSPITDINKLNNVDNKSQRNENHNITIESEQNSFIKQYSIISQPTFNQIQEAVLLILNLPNYSCDHNQLIALSRKRKIDVSLQIAVQLNSTTMNATNSNNYNHTITSSKLITNSNDLIRKKRILSELDQLDSNTMKLNEWYQYCPIKVKYLLIAAFLAGMNPKESDRMKFIGDKVERRKKQRIGSDNNPDQLKNGSSSNTELRNSQQRNNGFIQYFSLERLISIYVQIVSIITHQSPKGYGDVSIYSTIKNLVEKHILKESLSWSINRPLYTSCITQTTAEELAKSINFNIHDFIYEKNRITML